MNAHPHGGGRLAAAGPRPEEARLTVVVVHGRGGDPEDMLGLAGELGPVSYTHLTLPTNREV